MITAYCRWLCERVGLDLSLYGRLALCLYSLPFEWPGRIAIDENRSCDGVMLRYYYESATRIPYPYDGRDCSVLEMMVALCERIDDIAGEPGEIHYDYWFSVMLKNLDLLNETNDNFNEDRVKSICMNWMARNIDPDGHGGAFPLMHPMEDQRDLSIWDQMSCYINENY